MILFYRNLAFFLCCPFWSQFFLNCPFCVLDDFAVSTLFLPQVMAADESLFPSLAYLSFFATSYALVSAAGQPLVCQSWPALTPRERISQISSQFCIWQLEVHYNDITAWRSLSGSYKSKGVCMHITAACVHTYAHAPALLLNICQHPLAKASTFQPCAVQYDSHQPPMAVYS